jgi:hypothetical protein
VRDGHLVQPGTLFKTIRIHFHILREDDGSNPAATRGQIQNALEELNAAYAPWHINFKATRGYVNDSRYRWEATDEMKWTYAIVPQTTCNIFVNGEWGNWGTFPWDPAALTSLGGIVYGENYLDVPGTLAHEMGHCLGLWHTHHGVSEVTPCGACYEVPSPASDVTGDFCGDTPPTPINQLCSPPGGTDGCSGLPWGPTQPENYMSYGGLDPPCWTMFTPQQAARMHCWIEDALPGWLVCASTLDCNGNLTPDDCDVIAAGDFDADGISDWDDFEALGAYVAGPRRTPVVAEPGCLPAVMTAFDRNGDSDVDLADCAVFQVYCASGGG